MRPFVLGLIFAFFLLIPITKADQLFTTEDMTMIDTSNRLLDSLVRVSPAVGDHGSGFFVAANRILTNYHVVKNGGAIYVETRAGKRCAAEVLYQEWDPDLALLHTACEGAALELSTVYAVGQTALAAGHPASYKFTVSKGIVSGSKWNMLQFDARVTTGSSGGPLANISGQVIGVVVAQDKDLDYINFAISGQEVTKFLKRAE